MEQLTFQRIIEDDDDGLQTDPFCDPNNPYTLQFKDIQSAKEMIQNGVAYTPCLRSQLSDELDMELYFKMDFLQHTGSFKERGARYALLKLSDHQKQIGVISASLGNHAQAIAYHGFLLNIPVTVVMPVVAPIMKISKCREYNATVVVQGSNMAESKLIAMRLGKATGQLYINGYDHPHIIAGQGTLGMEIMEQVENVDAVVVPVGGGGLVAGTAVAVKTLNHRVKIIGVESHRCASFSKALSAGKPVLAPLEATLADGLAVPMVGVNAFKTAQPLIDQMIMLYEEWIASAILKLVETQKLVVEGAGAIPLAAVLSGKLKRLKEKTVVLVLSGGNIDTTVLARCIDRGLAIAGRLVKVKVIINDRPGGLLELVARIAAIGVSIKNMTETRVWVNQNVFSVEATVICETNNSEHADQLDTHLKQYYEQIKLEI